MLKLIIAFLLSLVFIDFLFLHIQMFLFGSIVFPNVIFKLLLLISLFLYFAINKKIFIKNYSLTTIYILYIVYLLFDYLFLWLYFGYSGVYFLISFMSFDYFTFIIFFLFLFSKVEKGDNNKFTFVILVIGCIALLGALEQYLIGTNNFIIATSDKKVNASDFYGIDRLFSFFSSGLNFGVFLSFLFVIVLSYIKPILRIKNILLILLILLILFFIYNTFTRNIYLMVLMSLFSYFFLFIFSKRILKYLPYIYGLVMSLFLSYTAMTLKLEKSTEDNGIDSVRSTFARFLNWDNAINKFVEGDTISQLFGLGLIQNGRVDNGLTIDNSFLGLLLQHGLIGLILFIYLYHRIWIYLLNDYFASKKRLSMVTVIVFSTFIAVNMLNSIYALYFIILSYYFLFSTYRRGIRY